MRHRIKTGKIGSFTPTAIDIVSKADIFVVIGTSLKVYPAAGFINYAHHEHLGFTHFKTTASEGMKMLLEAFKEL